MFIFPQPKKIAYNGEFKETKRSFKLVRDDFNSPDLEHAMSKLEWSDDGIELSVILNADLKKEEYYLELNNEGASITASTPHGVFDAIMTLCQAIRQSDLHCFRIEDYPDFENRCVMLDVSRGRIPKISVLKDMLDVFANTKYNQFQLCFTDRIVYEYKGFEKYYKGKNIIDAEYVRAVREHCEKNFIKLVPHQCSFGHMGGWLCFDEFNEFAECPNGFDWIDEYNFTIHCTPSTLDPNDPRSLKLMDRLYAGMLSEFPGDLLNVCCDETFELGKGKSKECAEKYGIKKVYTDFMQKLDKICKKYNRRMMFWADMIVDDEQALRAMPDDSIALVWGYEQEHPFDKQCQAVKERGLEFYVAPGTSSWSAPLGRSDNMKENLYESARYGKKHGASGYMLTDWETQFKTLLYVPFVYGAGAAWGAEENKDIRYTFEYLDDNLFFEKGFSEFLYDCGNAYKFEAYKRFNATTLFYAIKENVYDAKHMFDQKVEHFENMLAYSEKQLDKLGSFKNCSQEFKDEIKNQLKLTIALAKICIIKMGGEVSKTDIISNLEEFKEEYIRLWLKNNHDHCTNQLTDKLDMRIAELK